MADRLKRQRGMTTSQTDWGRKARAKYLENATFLEDEEAEMRKSCVELGKIHEAAETLNELEDLGILRPEGEVDND